MIFINKLFRPLYLTLILEEYFSCTVNRDGLYHSQNYFTFSSYKYRHKTGKTKKYYEAMGPNLKF